MMLSRSAATLPAVALLIGAACQRSPVAPPLPDGGALPGLDARPANPSCVAPARPATAVKLSRVFGAQPLSLPLLTLQAPGEPRWHYVVQKGGVVRRLSADGSVGATFVDLSQRVNSGPNEAGLLGMAFHPRWRTNGQVFVSYTAHNSSPSPGNTANLVSRVSRLITREGGLTLDPSSEVLLFQQEQPYIWSIPASSGEPGAPRPVPQLIARASGRACSSATPTAAGRASAIAGTRREPTRTWSAPRRTSRSPRRPGRSRARRSASPATLPPPGSRSASRRRSSITPSLIRAAVPPTSS